MALQGITGHKFLLWGIQFLSPVEQPGCTAQTGHCRHCALQHLPSVLFCHNSLFMDVLVRARGQDASYSTSYCCFLSGKSIVIFFFFLIEGQNGPCNLSCRLWCSFSYFWVCALLLCQEQRKCLSKTFSHELVKMKRFLGENKAVAFKEGGASKKSGKNRSVRIFIYRSGEGGIGVIFTDVMCWVLISQQFECLEHRKSPSFSTIELWLHLENQTVLRENIFCRQFLELKLISGKDIAMVCGPFIAILVKNYQLQHVLYKTLV